MTRASKPSLHRASSAGHVAPFEQISAHLILRLGKRPKEVFAVVFLDRNSKIIRVLNMFFGGRDLVRVSVAEIARAAYRYGAHSIIVSHNHPMGDPRPSAQDISLTRRLHLLMAVAGVPLRDHIIVTASESHSMAAQGPWDVPLEDFVALLEPDSKRQRMTTKTPFFFTPFLALRFLRVHSARALPGRLAGAVRR
jgi:DNA repair protein RadC